MTILDTGLYLGNVERSISHGGLKVSYTLYQSDHSLEIMHAHANPHFSLVLRGGNLEKRRNKELQRLPGVLTFYHTGEQHQNQYEVHGSAHLNIELEPYFLRRLEIEEAEFAAILHEPAAKFLFLKLYNELLIRDDVSPLNAETILLDLIQNGKACSREKPGWIGKLDQYLRANLDGPLSLNVLSAEVGVHPITISKHVPKYFSCSLGEYIRKLRTERALELIGTSSLSLTRISTACGFTDQSHFTRTFKKYTSFLPKEFRKS